MFFLCWARTLSGASQAALSVTPSVEEWQALQLSTASAKLLIYQAFIEDEFGFPRHLARRVHDLYFQPVHEEFQPRTMWSLSNAFTSAFKDLEPIPQYKATAKLAGFLQAVRPS